MKRIFIFILASILHLSALPINAKTHIETKYQKIATAIRNICWTWPANGPRGWAGDHWPVGSLVTLKSQGQGIAVEIEIVGKFINFSGRLARDVAHCVATISPRRPVIVVIYLKGSGGGMSVCGEAEVDNADRLSFSPEFQAAIDYTLKKRSTKISK